jgi:hypothetical protein
MALLRRHMEKRGLTCRRDKVIDGDTVSSVEPKAGP